MSHDGEIVGSPFISDPSHRDPSGSKPAKISDAAERRFEELKKRYPDARSSIMPALYIAQEELGYISNEVILWVATRLSLPPVQVMEVASFYTMFYKRPVGKYHFQVCRTLSCALRGAKQITEHLKKRFNILPGETTPDGMWSYEEVECLGSCGTAPMCEINDCYFENLTPEKLDEIINRIQQEKPDLRLSMVRGELGAGLKGWSKSEVI